MTFPNRAGRPVDENDEVLAAELTAAGIVVEKHDYLLDEKREVNTRIMGTLHGWMFRRAWYYWFCKGPGIEVAAAAALHAAHGTTVRVDGHCGCPAPREWNKGLAVDVYHVDDAAGLKALADTIKRLVSGPVLVPISYELFAGKNKPPMDQVRLERCGQRDGSFLWAIRQYGNCLGREGEWEWEPQPSNRDDEFFARCRYKTVEEAVAVWERTPR